MLASFVKELDADTRTLLETLTAKWRTYAPDYGRPHVFLLDGDAREARDWLKKTKAKLNVALVPAHAATLEAWNLDSRNGTTFVAADDYNVHGVLADPRLDTFKEDLARACAPEHRLASLMRHCDDPAIERRCDAIVGLRFLEPEVARPALKELGDLLLDGSPQVREVAVGTLGAMGDPATVEPDVVYALRDAASRVRIEALRVLWMHPSPRPPVRTMARLLTDAERDVRAYAARALGLLGSRAADVYWSVHSALADEDPRVRKNAADALKCIDPSRARTGQMR